MAGMALHGDPSVAYSAASTSASEAAAAAAAATARLSFLRASAESAADLGTSDSALLHSDGLSLFFRQDPSPFLTLSWPQQALHLFLPQLDPPKLEFWQTASLCLAVAFLAYAKSSRLTLRVRRALQPVIIRHVDEGTHFVVRIQTLRRAWLDKFMSAMAMAVSVEFYTAFLPILFWLGREEVAVSLAMLLALCTYIGNSTKDIVCAPRPHSPPVTRVTRTGPEKNNSMEYGLPSSHTINTLSLSLYMLWAMWLRAELDIASAPLVISFFVLFVTVVVFGRLYLGMHSPIDLVAGAVIGCLVTGLWISVDAAVLRFITSAANVIPFMAAMCVFLLFAYPTPQHPTPSFQDHNAFVGVVLGLSAAMRWSHRAAPPLGLSSLGLLFLAQRVAVGLPVILLAKAVGKHVAVLCLPALCSAFGVKVMSSKYVAWLMLPSSDEQGRPEQGEREEEGEGEEALGEEEDAGVVKFVRVCVDGQSAGSCSSGSISSSNSGSSISSSSGSSPRASSESSVESGGEEGREHKSSKEGTVCVSAEERMSSRCQNGSLPPPGPVVAVQRPGGDMVVRRRRVGKRKEEGAWEGQNDTSQSQVTDKGVRFQRGTPGVLSSNGGPKAREESPEEERMGLRVAESEPGTWPCLDVDTGIRFVAYTALAWSVGGLAPALFALLRI